MGICADKCPSKATFRRAVRRLDRLLDALADPRRADRTMLVLLVGYCVVWTLYGIVAKGSQDLHFDMGEMVAWSREVSWGTRQASAARRLAGGGLVRGLPARRLVLLSVRHGAGDASLWIAWLAAAPYLDGDKRAVGIALLTLVPFFNFHALKYNANTVMTPLWALATWTFLRSFETRKLAWAAFAGRRRGRGDAGQILVGGAARRARPRRAGRSRAAPPISAPARRG